ncbi:hypothetical protein [Tellurirhabdus bombi]|uniref:hypothetical protein n=1 Tax=Tellurirhabdus bombi TaxID=2907205 RepID=UPI001F23661E|nr:hypothetical protein [Tellurirhabdus bombi]
MNRKIWFLSLLYALLATGLTVDAQYTMRLTDPVGQSQTPPPGYNRVYVINPNPHDSPVLDLSVPANHKFVIYNFWTKSQVKTGPNGWKYVDDWRNYGGDRSWVIRQNAYIRDSYRPDVPIVAKTLTGNGTTGLLLPLFEEWYLRSEGQLAVHGKNAPPLTSAEKAALANKVFGGSILDGKATNQELKDRGWKFFELRTAGNRMSGLDWETELYYIPNGEEFSSYIGHAPYTGPVIWPPHAAPTWEQGVQAANAGVNSIPHGLFIEQTSEAKNPAHASPVLGPGNLAYNYTIRQKYPNKINTSGYGENVQLPVPNENYLHPDFRHYYIGNARKMPNGDDDPFFKIRWNNQSFHSAGITPLNQHYADDPGDPDFTVKTLFKLEVKKKQTPDRPALLFMWPWCETPDDNSRWGSTQWDLKTTSPGGKVRYVAGMIPDIIGIELCWVAHMIEGGGGLLWSDTNNHIDDPNKIGAAWEPSHTWWMPNSSQNSSFPYVPDGQPSRPRFPYIGYDAAYAGVRKAAKILAHLGTDQVTARHATWSSGGVVYAAPADGTGLLQSAHYRRPIVKIYSGNGKLAVVACDLFCSAGARKTITVELGNDKTIDIPLEGNAIHAVLVGASGSAVTPPVVVNPPVVNPPVNPPTGSVSSFALPQMALTYYLNNNNVGEHTSALTQFKNAATDNGAHPEIKWGAALSQFWHNWETSPGVWNQERATQLKGIMDWAQANGAKMGFRPVCLRNYHEKGSFLTDDQCQRDWRGNISVGLLRSVEHYEYSVQALTNAGELYNNSNPAVRARYTYVKHLANLLKPYYLSGTLTYALLGAGQNEESNLAGDLGQSPPLYSDFHEVVRQGYVSYYNLPGGTQLPQVNEGNAWSALTQQANRLFTNYRTYTLGHALLLQAVAIYEVMPGLPIFIDVGQSVEGGGVFVGSWNTPELLQIVRSGLASRFPGQTVRVYLKKNPAPSYNMTFDGALAAAHSLSANDPEAPSATEQDYYTASLQGNNGLVDGSEGGYQMAQKAVAAAKGAGGQHITFLAQCQDQDGGSYPGAAWNLALETARQYARMDKVTGRKSGQPTHTYTYDPNTHLNASDFKGDLINWYNQNGQPRFRFIKSTQ